MSLHDEVVVHEGSRALATIIIIVPVKGLSHEILELLSILTLLSTCGYYQAMQMM